MDMNGGAYRLKAAMQNKKLQGGLKFMSVRLSFLLTFRYITALICFIIPGKYLKISKTESVGMSHKWQLLRQCRDGEFFSCLKSELLYLQGLESLGYFKVELIEYIDYYNNRRIKASRKGLLPALHRQQALLAA